MTVRTVRYGGLLAVLTILMVATVLTGCADDTPDAIAPEPPAAENGDGAQVPEADEALVLVETKCSGCHALSQVWAADYDRAGWEAAVARMEDRGLQVTPEERETIIDYLVEN